MRTMDSIRLVTGHKGVVLIKISFQLLITYYQINTHSSKLAQSVLTFADYETFNSSFPEKMKQTFSL